MKKEDLTAAIASKANVTKVKAKEILEAILEAFQEALRQREDITLTNFGTLSVVNAKARMGKNPKTGEPISIPACKKVKFRTSSQLKSMLN